MFRVLAVAVALLTGAGVTSDRAGYFTGAIFVELLFIVVWWSLRRAKRPK